jgi:hypothetical protein
MRKSGLGENMVAGQSRVGGTAYFSSFWCVRSIIDLNNSGLTPNANTGFKTE